MSAKRCGHGREAVSHSASTLSCSLLRPPRARRRGRARTAAPPARSAHALQQRQRQPRLPGLQQAVGEDTQHAAVVELQLGQVRQDAQAELELALEEHLGRVEVEGRAGGLPGALVEVDGVALP
jgi:carbon monoxide dehydrogenase subunit G